MSESPERLHKGLIAGGVLAGFPAGLISLGLFIGVFASLRVRQEARSIHHAWTLTPVVVTARDVPTGAKLTADDLGERDVPEQLVTASMLKPDEASGAVGQRTVVPLKRGDLLSREFFDLQPEGMTAADLPLLGACEKALGQVPDHRPAETTAEAIEMRLAGLHR